MTQDPVHGHRHLAGPPGRVLQPAAHLESWVERPWVDGVQVDALRDLDMLFVRR